MPQNPNLPASELNGYVNMNAAPGADLSFDDLFPPEGVQNQQPPQTATQGNEPQPPPQAPDQPFLKAGSSVYLTAEDASTGLAHKDQLIERYRTFLKESGVDPNTMQRVAPPQAQQPEPTPAPSGYSYFGDTNAKKFYDDLAKAASQQDYASYSRIMAAYQSESQAATLAPYAPLLAEVARSRAVRRVSEQAPDFESFQRSEEFKQVQERVPLLGNAISQSESNPIAAEQLEQLYQIAYLVNRGLKVQSQAQVTPAAQPVTTPVRPTTPAQTITPPAPNASPAEHWSTMAREDRKRFVEEQRQKVGNVDWRNVGL